MKQNTNELYAEYTSLMLKAADINYAAAVLGWDQETYMPGKGAHFRSRQLATLASQAHELLTSPHLEELLVSLAETDLPDEDQKYNVRLSLEDLEKSKKLSPDFVEELSRQTSECYNAWIDARRKNDFRVFAPSLAKMIVLKRQQAALFGYDDHPYDALLDEYEKGATVAMLDPIFDGIKEQLPVLLGKIKAAEQVDDSCLKQFYPKQLQWDFGVKILKEMGFDFEAGRQDYSEHPFTTSFSPADVRLTTRANEHDMASMLWSCIHEGGHGLYEQGLSEAQYGLPLGSAASLGIHESQSRLWENCVGRSHDFWSYYYPRLQQVFPAQLGHVSLDAFYKAMNRVAPSLVRTEADEVTYHFHVLIRYELEKGLISGSIDANDLPEKWNELYEQYLGVKPADDLSGVLQDIHWSHGSFGYFPTYTLGSFYAAQFFEQANYDLPELQLNIINGNLEPLTNWLREKVHRHGRRYTSDELCKKITGKTLDVGCFLRYIDKKYAGIYKMEG